MRNIIVISYNSKNKGYQIDNNQFFNKYLFSLILKLSWSAIHCNSTGKLFQKLPPHRKTMISVERKEIRGLSNQSGRENQRCPREQVQWNIQKRYENFLKFLMKIPSGRPDFPLKCHKIDIGMLKGANHFFVSLAKKLFISSLTQKQWLSKLNKSGSWGFNSQISCVGCHLLDSAFFC